MFSLSVRIAFLLLLFCCENLLMSCSDDTIAPVVNAWYQARPESNRYVVRQGDTIYSIAWSFGLDYRLLAEANHLNPPYTVTPGQHLVMTYTPAGQMKSQQPQPQLTRQLPQTIQKKPHAEWQHVILNSRWNWPTRGRIIQGYSRSQIGHPGISIAGRLGSPIRAAASGTVVYSGDGVRGYGNLIIIKHNESYLSAYAFNQRNLVRVGERVHAGTVIARMGQNDAGHTLLYFEIRRDGIPVNPLKYL
ncbi:MAG: hypothetical protein A3C44_06665 [Gammaproteobacteria bacterium RIFCSPHIGHO2_02_FULL_39_13]|nr:MAG: hypothetical protein A3C44_06665 [Gammaproteobacteria bacterium RIFCSPHIGHO2_02_FULL_39_13]OGT49783.1 MAG: hypothetical protein A3E53_04800 [Gammaproteobacteria bacterium RIFCSPHIGHO2_12_FULL_39_24]